MTSSDPLGALDNPFWSSLTTRHAHLALGTTLARRYPVAISPLAGLPAVGPRTVSALEAIVDVGDDVGIVGPFVPPLPGTWEMLRESRITQMVRADRSPMPEGDVEIAVLGAAAVPEMLALVELTKPGPFRSRTSELGTFVGIHEGGRLVAMAGERAWVADLREVSAVCVHPDVERRGYARALIGRVVNRMLRAGQTPFLHVESGNTRAIEIYAGLGFVRRAEFPLLHARRAG